MQAFKTQADLDAYKKHVATVAAEKFAALEGLGPVTPEMSLARLPDTGPWSFPARAAAEGFKLMLTGPPGGGKTTLLKKIVWGLCLRRRRPRGGYVLSIMDKLKTGDIGAYIANLQGGDTLVLDDIDKLRGTEYEVERLLDVINHYDVNRLPILMTGNGELESFNAKLRKRGIPDDMADSITSRLKNKCSFKVLMDADRRSPA